MIFVPGGAMDIALKSNVPKFCAYANNIGFVLDVLSKFIVIYVFSLSNTTNKSDFFSTDTNPSTK